MDEFTEKYGKTAVIPALVNGVVSISLYPNRYLCRNQEHVKSAFPGAVGTRKNQSKTAYSDSSPSVFLEYKDGGLENGTKVALLPENIMKLGAEGVDRYGGCVAKRYWNVRH